uniref:Uncharacterized protein n=1 Tax=Fagus sylvatica TaxID=28930 RepID=A0A2N9I4M9_FAGSY
MTVKHANESQERVSSVSDLQKPKAVITSSPEQDLRIDSRDLAGENVSKKVMKYVHSQILKIREEDSHLGEEFCLGVKDNSHHHADSQMAMVIFARPSSPLSGKTTTVKAFH